MGTVYVLHFDRPLRHARHYIGYAARDLQTRLDDHAIGRGARLTQVARERGIGWHCSLTIPGDRVLERAIKTRGSGARICPECRAAYLAARREAARRRREARRCAL